MARGAVPVYSEYFNSQPHEEADLMEWEMLLGLFYFNSQPHEEADDDSTDPAKYSWTFQLTASRRG